MQETGRQAIEHIDLPILEASFVTEEDSLQRRVSTPESYLASHPYSADDAAGGDDFDLSSDAAFSEEDESAFDLDNDLRLSEQPVDSAESNDLETFRLQSSEIEPPVRAESIEPPVRSDSSEPPVRATPGAAVDAIESPISKRAVAEPSSEEDLLKIAADEEQDIQRVRKSMRSKDTFVIFCPQGCRIRVKERHRGRSGKCPRCQSEFVVPRKLVAKKSEDEGASGGEPLAASRYKKWLDDVRLHTVDPQKLRIKADSLLNECQAVDVGFSAEDLIIATLVVGKFGANVKKMPPVRQAMIEHFFKQGSVEQLAVPAKKVYLKELIAQFTIAQPAPIGTESLFGDIPVFGINRIAVRIPRTPDAVHPQYLSFCLSEFRAFVEGIQTVCGVESFGLNTEVPLTDEYLTSKCNLSGVSVRELTRTNYYEKDPGYKLEVTGWRCAACGIVVSEEARAQAKLGGANGKGLAKAKCPKCTLKFGNLPLYQLAGTDSEQPATTEPEPAMA